MPHINAVPWDADILAKLATAPYSDHPQDGSADATLAAMMNAETVTPSGKVDVQIADVEAYLALQGKLALIDQFAQTGAFTADAQNNNALVAAKELIRIISSPRLNSFAMSDPAHYAGIQAFLGYLVANGNITAQNQSDILALANAPPIPWWRSIGAPSPLNEHDLSRARTP